MAVITQTSAKITCCVTNDLNQDQRMHRICKFLTINDYVVNLVGRKKTDSLPLNAQIFNQLRLNCFFHKGPVFYFEYNLRLFWHLLFSKSDIIYSVDYDTLPGCAMAARIKGKKLIFDAHEYFTEVPELQGKTVKKLIWNLAAKLFVPLCDVCITVNQSLVDIFSKKFNKYFYVIYNAPEKQYSDHRFLPALDKKPYVLLYQGMLNQGRGLEAMIEAMPMLPDCELWLAGDGDITQKLKELADNSPAKDRIHFKGWQNHDNLKALTKQATLGLNLLEKDSLNYYYSLANKFFDYLHAGIPAVHMDFPEYRMILDEFETGITLPDLQPATIAEQINNLITDNTKYKAMQAACIKAAEKYNWEAESLKLFQIFGKLRHSS
jgi:glycosyltransferase involved in cell wall biosynthesis